MAAEVKAVLVELENLHLPSHEGNEHNDIEFTSVAGVTCDLKEITKKLIVKSSSFGSCFKHSIVTFKKPSAIDPLVLRVTSGDSPIKHGSKVLCTIRPKLQMNLAGIYDTSTDVVDMSRVPVHSLSADAFSRDHGGACQSRSVYPPLTLLDGSVVDLLANRADGFDSDEEESPIIRKRQKVSKAYSSGGAVLKGRLTGFKIPFMFNVVIDQKIKQSSATFKETEYSVIVRIVCDSLKSFLNSYSPTNAELESVVHLLLEKLPSLSLRSVNKGQSNADGNYDFFVDKLRRRFARMRQDAVGTSGLQLTRGRPRIARDISSPGNIAMPRPVAPADTVSYNENVEQLLVLYRSAAPNPSSIKSMMEVTFPGRYAELHNNDATEEVTPADFILNRCPFLSEPEYLLLDFERQEVWGDVTDICDTFRQRFNELVPWIIEAAKLRNTTGAIKEILASTKYKQMDSDKALQALAALELLPKMLVGQSKAKNAGRFFIDCRGESADITSAINEVKKRERPFLLCLSTTSIYLVINGAEPIPIKGGGVEAVLALVAAYYVFDRNYAAQVLPTLLFLQLHCLNLEDDKTRGCTSLRFLTSTIEKLKKPDEEEDN